MRDHEVYDCLLMVLLVDRRGDNERVVGFKIQIGFERCTITLFGLVPALANVRCRPFGNFSRLPFGRSINNQDVQDIPPDDKAVASIRPWLRFMSSRPSLSADAFTQVVILVQPIDLHPQEVTPGDDAPNPSALDDRKMTEAAIAHLTQCIDCATIGSDCYWIRRHRLRQGGYLSALAFSKRAHCIAAGEDASQTLLVIKYH